MFELLALVLAGMHFGIPLIYYLYAKSRWLPKPWNLRIDESYRPKVTIIIPTYNEAKYIVQRLNNIYEQDYPRELIEVIVVDSASTDGTPEIVEGWVREHGDLKLKLLKESVRSGKARAMNYALQYVEGEVVVIADADALWARDTLSRAIRWLSDASVGAVSCLKKPLNPGPSGVEEGYRNYYNILRVAESKAYSTPVFHGELAVFKTNLLRSIGGFPEDIGADDSHTATRIALMRYRAIIPDDIWIYERIPKKGYTSWRIRRAQHLVQHFTKALKNSRSPGKFKKILLFESYLHLVNPWILALVTVILTVSIIIYHNLLSTAMLVLGLTFLVYKPYKTWIATQIYLIIGAIKNISTKEIVWTKQAK